VVQAGYRAKIEIYKPNACGTIMSIEGSVNRYMIQVCSSSIYTAFYAHLQSPFYLPSRVPSMGALPKCSLHKAPIERGGGGRERERDTPPPELISAISV
jgi:hypothetical protein